MNKPDPEKKAAMDKVMMQDLAGDVELVTFLEIRMPKRFQRVVADTEAALRRQERDEPDPEEVPTVRDSEWLAIKWLELAPPDRDLLFMRGEQRVEGRVAFGAIVPFDGSDPEGITHFRLKPQRTIERRNRAPDAESDAARLALKQDQQFERHVIEWAKGQYLAMFEEPDAEATPAPEPEPHNFPENMSDKLVDWDTEASLTTADLTEDVIQKLTAAKRRKFTELLNVELAELQQERGGPREDLEREAEIEKLLGLFARVGEM